MLMHLYKYIYHIMYINMDILHVLIDPSCHPDDLSSERQPLQRTAKSQSPVIQQMKTQIKPQELLAASPETQWDVLIGLHFILVHGWVA